MPEGLRLRRTGNLVFAFNYGTAPADLPESAIKTFLLGAARLAPAGVAVGTAS
jgi:beta-galactosidase